MNYELEIMEKDIILQVGVKILFKNKQGKFLLVRRSAKKYPNVFARWDIIGGRINPGSSLIENLKREVKEETGLKIKGVPKLVAAQDIFRKSGYHIVRLTYVGEPTGRVVLDTEENDAYKWYSVEELKKLEGVDVYFKELLDDGSAYFKALEKYFAAK